MELFNIEYEYVDTFKLKKPYYMNTVWEIVETESGKQIACG